METKNDHEILNRLKIILILSFTSCITPIYSQIVFETTYRSEADFILFETGWRADADFIIYKTESRGEARGREGNWYFTKYRGEAGIKIFFTKFRSKADLKKNNIYERGVPVINCRNDRQIKGWL